MKVVIEVLAAPAMLGETCHAWMALAIMADATQVASRHIGEEDVGTEVDSLSGPLEAPASARKFVQIAIRRTPGQVHAARTKERTARSSSRRGSTTEALGLWDGLRRISLDAGSAQSAPVQRAEILLRTGSKPKNFRSFPSGSPRGLNPSTHP